MLGFGGVEKDSGGACGAQRGGDVVAYLTGFAESGYDHLSPILMYGIEYQLYSLGDSLVNRDIADTFNLPIDQVPDKRFHLFHQGAKIGLKGLGGCLGGEEIRRLGD